MAAVYCLLWAGLEYIDWEMCYCVYQHFRYSEDGTIYKIMNKGRLLLLGKMLKNIKNLALTLLVLTLLVLTINTIITIIVLLYFI